MGGDAHDRWLEVSDAISSSRTLLPATFLFRSWSMSEQVERPSQISTRTSRPLDLDPGTQSTGVSLPHVPAHGSLCSDRGNGCVHNLEAFTMSTFPPRGVVSALRVGRTLWLDRWLCLPAGRTLPMGAKDIACVTMAKTGSLTADHVFSSSSFRDISMRTGDLPLLRRRSRLSTDV